MRKRLRTFRKKFTKSPLVTCAVAAVFFLAIWLYNKTLRCSRLYRPGSMDAVRGKACYGFWHGRQFPLIPNFTSMPVTLLADVSWIGRVHAQVLRWFGYQVVFGSSRHGGAAATRALIAALKQGRSVALALDGPRGPIHCAKPGLLFLARKSHCPIVPVAVSIRNAWTFRSSWCQFMLPKPFSRCLITFGEPLALPDATTAADVAAVTSALRALTVENDLRTTAGVRCPAGHGFRSGGLRTSFTAP